jgi:hypothetical protein
MSGARLPWLRGLRLAPTVEVELVNLSAHGALLVTPTRFRPGSRTTLQVTGTIGRWNVAGSVSRARVVTAEVGHPVVYQIALAFDDAFAPTAEAA